MTQVGNVRPDMTGRRVRAVEEPLVARVLQKNVPVNGKREWALGMFNSLKVFRCVTAADIATVPSALKVLLPMILLLLSRWSFCVICARM